MTLSTDLQGPDRRPPVVLLTGGTGFLGGALASELLRSARDARLLFLVRERNVAAAVEKLRRNVQRFGAPGRDLERVRDATTLCGTLGELATRDDPRLGEVTHLINCAALVSFAWNREVWRINVEETEAFAARASNLPKLRRFVHVSTTMVSGASRDRCVSEPEFPGTARQFTLYTKSKAEIERRLRRILGGSLVIARPSVIVGHSELGCHPCASIFWLFRMIHASRRIPFPADRRIDVVPVDYCARALAALLFRQYLAYDCYHVSAGEAGGCSFTEIDAAFFRARGAAPSHALETFDIDRISDLESHFEDWFGACDTSRAAAAIRVYTAFAGLNVTFDNRRLLNEGVPPPPRFCDYLKACMRSASRVSISDQMACDMR